MNSFLSWILLHLLQKRRRRANKCGLSGNLDALLTLKLVILLLLVR